MADRAIEILSKNGDPDSDIWVRRKTRRGNAFIALGRGIEAEASSSAELRIYQRLFAAVRKAMAFPFRAWVRPGFSRGHRSPRSHSWRELCVSRCTAPNRLRFNIAETRYWLARALWDKRTGSTASREARDRGEERSCAHEMPRRERAVVEWLAEHQLRSLRHSRPD